MPTISKKIHDENQSADFKINFKGLGLGNAAIDPPNSFVYGEYLYQVNEPRLKTDQQVLMICPLLIPLRMD